MPASAVTGERDVIPIPTHTGKASPNATITPETPASSPPTAMRKRPAPAQHKTRRAGSGLTDLPTLKRWTTQNRYPRSSPLAIALYDDPARRTFLEGCSSGPVATANKLSNLSMRPVLAPQGNAPRFGWARNRDFIDLGLGPRDSSLTPPDPICEAFPEVVSPPGLGKPSKPFSS